MSIFFCTFVAVFTYAYMHEPKISIIIPLYNKAPYIQKALDSVLAQTYTDWELIIVNDGSTDNSQQVVEDYLQSTICNGRNGSQSSIQLISQPNSGVSVARNNGVAMAKGEYIAFLDADDWWAPTFLESMLLLVKQYPDAGIYGCNYWYVKTGKTHVAICGDSIMDSGYVNYPKMYLECGAMPLTSISVLIPKRIFDEGLKFPINVKLGEDFLTWSKIALSNKVAFLNEPLVYYNNNVPVSARATRNLHKPAANMLFNMQHLANVEQKNTDWKVLCDRLRVGGLISYWMDSQYHDLAAEELQKVDWNRLMSCQNGKLSQWTKSYRRKYRMPIWLLRTEHRMLKFGSRLKQLLKLWRVK